MADMAGMNRMDALAESLRALNKAQGENREAWRRAHAINAKPEDSTQARDSDLRVNNATDEVVARATSLCEPPAPKWPHQDPATGYCRTCGSSLDRDDGSCASSDCPETWPSRYPAPEGPGRWVKQGPKASKPWRWVKDAPKPEVIPTKAEASARAQAAEESPQAGGPWQGYRHTAPDNRAQTPPKRDSLEGLGGVAMKSLGAVLPDEQRPFKHADGKALLVELCQRSFDVQIAHVPESKLARRRAASAKIPKKEEG